MFYAQNDKVRVELEAMGVDRKKIYEEKDGERWEKIRLYRGEGLGIIGGLKAFGGKVDIRNALDRFRKQGVTIMDCKTGQNSHDDIVKMLDASATLRRYSLDEKEARARARADVRRTKSGAMILRDAYVEWHKKDGRTAAEKADDIGWPLSSLYAEFGKTGAPAGRRPNQLVV